MHNIDIVNGNSTLQYDRHRASITLPANHGLQQGYITLGSPAKRPEPCLTGARGSLSIVGVLEGDSVTNSASRTATANALTSVSIGAIGKALMALDELSGLGIQAG